jgi:hypothetical protein
VGSSGLGVERRGCLGTETDVTGAQRGVVEMLDGGTTGSIVQKVACGLYPVKYVF